MQIDIFNPDGSPVEAHGNSYVVFETHKYFIKSNEDYQYDHIVLEGVLDQNTGDDKHVFFDEPPKLLFINCLGIFTFSNPDGEKIGELNILSKKLNDSQAMGIFEYVFEKNSEVFEALLNRQRFFTAEPTSIYNSELPLLKYIGVLRELYTTLEKNFYYFKSKPAYKLKTTIRKVDYKERFVTPKSIEWILENLDEIEYGNSLKFDHSSMEIGGTFAIPRKIIAELNKKDVDIYENKILIGAIDKLGRRIQKLSIEISEYLNSNDLFDGEFASFESLKRIIFKSELKHLNKLKRGYRTLKASYYKLFSEVAPIENYPRMTHTFKKERHYRELYHRILAFYKAGLNYPGTFIVLGIRNIDVLYEYYNFYAITEIFKQKFGNSEVQFDENQILYFTFSSNQETYRVYYQLRINRRNSPPAYPWVKLFANSSLSKYYCPDIVIEKEQGGEFRYAILDAKYSSKYWVTGQTFYKIVGKYNFSLSFRDEAYKKVDYLYLLYPNDGPPDILTKDKGYYPEMGAIPSVPSNMEPLINTILNILKDWEE